jgi:tRNA G26 N,N-dimethylase Trm1
MGKLNKINPLSGDIENFEELYDMYWEMEMDAHKFGLEWVEKIDKILNLPTENYELSYQIEDYPLMSDRVKYEIEHINELIRDLKSKGYEYSDISDLPLIKNIIDKLENFF